MCDVNRLLSLNVFHFASCFLLSFMWPFMEIALMSNEGFIAIKKMSCTLICVPEFSEIKKLRKPS
jgi:hypothetical protein